MNLAAATAVVTVAATFVPPTPRPPPTVLAPSSDLTPALSVTSTGLRPFESLASGSAPASANVSMAPSFALVAAR